MLDDYGIGLSWNMLILIAGAVGTPSFSSQPGSGSLQWKRRDCDEVH